MTTDLTDQNEREAICDAEKTLEYADFNHERLVLVDKEILRALLHRATRAHD